MHGVIQRFANVIYFLLLSLGLGISLLIGSSSWPYHYETYTYLVNCNNRKTFDPESKPINYRYISGNKKEFSNNQIKSECQYDTAYYTRGLVEDNNYSLKVNTYNNVDGSVLDAIKNSVGFFAIYFFVLEIARRLIVYIVTGKPFVSIKKRE